MNQLLNLLNNSKTSFHAVESAKGILNANGFIELDEKKPFVIEKNKNYYVTRNDSALIAFSTTETCSGFNIVASHTDSPCFKIKLGKNPVAAGVEKLPVESYGGGLRYTWFDRPLKLCGRLCGEKDGTVYSTLYESDKTFVIPSVAIHYRRNTNESFAVNVQTDCPPLFALGTDGESLKKSLKNSFDGTLLDCDLFLVCDQTPFTFGLNDEFICAPRIDNLTSCFSSLNALINSKNEEFVNVCYLADNEEVGSRTKQGAGSKFLFDILRRAFTALYSSNQDFDSALANSFLVSCDNAHAVHPNHPELSDPTDSVLLGSGIVIKHHGNQNYTSDGMSSAIFKNILCKNKVPYCDFYMRSDMPCGGTLGAISSSQVSIPSVDIGIAQLAMHSSCESFASVDYTHMTNGLTAFFNSKR